MKSIWENPKIQKMPFLQFQGLWSFDLDIFQPQENAKIYKFQNLENHNILKWHVLDI